MRALKLLTITSLLFLQCQISGRAGEISDALNACAVDTPTIFPSPAAVEILITGTSGVTAQAWQRYKGLAIDAVVAACRAGSISVEIRPIDGKSLEQGRVFFGAAPRRATSTNPFIVQDAEYAFISGALAALQKLRALPGQPYADILGSLEVAASATENAKVPRIAIVIGSGWQQAKIDTFSAGTNPSQFMQRFVAAHGEIGELPNLSGLNVLFVGVTAGPKDMGEYRHLHALCNNFWKPLIQEAHAIWRGCWSEFPSPLALSLR